MFLRAGLVDQSEIRPVALEWAAASPSPRAPEYQPTSYRGGPKMNFRPNRSCCPVPLHLEQKWCA